MIFAHVSNSSDGDKCALEISSITGIQTQRNECVVARRPYRFPERNRLNRAQERDQGQEYDQELIRDIPDDPALLRTQQIVPGIFGNGEAHELPGPRTKKLETCRSLTRDLESVCGEKKQFPPEEGMEAGQPPITTPGQYCGNQCFVFVLPTKHRNTKKFALQCKLVYQKGNSNEDSNSQSFGLTMGNIHGGTNISVAFVSVLNPYATPLPKLPKSKPSSDPSSHPSGAALHTQHCAAANDVYGSLLYGLCRLVHHLDGHCITDDNLMWLHGAVLKFCTELPACFLPLRRNSALAVLALSDPKLFNYPVMSYGGIGQVVRMLPKCDAEGLPLHEAVGLSGVLMSYFNICHKNPIKFKQEKSADVENKALQQEISNRNFTHFDVIQNTRAALAFLLAEEFSYAGLQGTAEDDHHARNYLVPAFSFAGLLSLVHHAIPNQDKEKLYQKSLGMGTLSTYAPSFRGDDKSEGWYQIITKDFQGAVDTLQRQEFDVALKSVATLQSQGKDMDVISSKLSETERALIVWNVTSSAISRHRSYDETLFAAQMLAMMQFMEQFKIANGGEVLDIGDHVRRNITASVTKEFDEAWATLLLAQRCTSASASDATASATTAGSQSQDASQQMVVANDLLMMASNQLAKIQPALEHASQRKDALAGAMGNYFNASAAFKTSNNDRNNKSKAQSWNDALHCIYHPVDFRHVEACTHDSSQSDSSNGDSAVSSGALVLLSRPAAYDFTTARVSASARKPSVYSSVTMVRDAQGSVVDIYAADAIGNAILSIAKDGTSHVVAGAPDGIPGYIAGRRSSCKFRGPQSICVLTLNSKARNAQQQHQQYLVIADTGNHCVRYISVAHTQQTEHLGPEIHILAGRSAAPGSADGAAAASSFRGPTGMVVCTFAPQNDKDTRVFATGQSECIVVCDTDNHVIRVIYYVPGVADEGRGVMGNNVFMVHTLVGEAGRPGTEDGTALEGVRLTLPSHITNDEKHGCLFFVEKGKVPAIRMYRDSDSQVTTLVRGGALLKNPSSLCVQTGNGTPASSSSSSSSSSVAVAPAILLLVCDPEAKCIWSLDVAQKSLMQKITLTDLVPAVLSALRVVGGGIDGEEDFVPIAIHCAAPGTYIISDERRPGELLRFFDGPTVRTAVDASRATSDELQTHCAEFSEKFSDYTSTLFDAARSVMHARIVTGERSFRMIAAFPFDNTNFCKCVFHHASYLTSLSLFIFYLFYFSGDSDESA